MSRQLALDSPEDAEFIVAKAIRDGVIDGEIDHQVNLEIRTFENFSLGRHNHLKQQKGHLFDAQSGDGLWQAYSGKFFTFKNFQKLNSSFKYCQQLHAQSVKAMRFPAKKFTDPLSAEERREREQTDLEFAKEMAEDDEDMF